jgi:hypothetical protein
MAINSYNLQSIKKELQHLSGGQLSDLCLRLAKYKKENKELLAYLLFEADNENSYIDNVKHEIDELFGTLPNHSYYQAKLLRKTLKLISKHSKFMASKPAEISLLLHFCRQYTAYIERRTTYKPLRQLLTKQLEKVTKLAGKLHEDLQYDFREELEQVIEQAAAKMSWINKTDYL